MPEISDRFDVLVTFEAYKLTADGTREKEADGSDKVFCRYPLFYRDVPLALMNRTQRALGEGLLDLGDEGLVMLGGDEAVAVLEAMRGAKEKAKAKKS